MALKRLLALLTASSCHCLETCCHAFQNDTELREAVRRWQQEVEGPGLISKYGDIADWDVGMVTNMSRLFADTSFNEPIGSWNTSAVTNMQSTLGGGAGHRAGIDLVTNSPHNRPLTPLHCLTRSGERQR